MKKLFAILFLLNSVYAVNTVCAAEVKLAWDYDGPADHTFRLYQGEAAGQYTVTKDFAAKEGIMDGLEPGKTYYFAATARTPQGLESGKSNELAVAIPLAPMELRLLITVSVE